MLTPQIRKGFLTYFKEKKHAVIASSPVIPHDDPTLLFTNAGMNQFKDVFLGETVRDYKRAASSQKCVRVGGKHNDLENVGHTSRHLTFFEMLGNFSFGDYFKKEAIAFAWEVSVNVFGYDPEKIWPTVFQTDDEAFELWKAYVPEKRITRLGEKDNFWAMGEVGPCGPCSELYYDRGPKWGPAASILEDTKGERYLEFWNLVFMQFNKDAQGVLHPLPKPSIDTGAGMERVVSLKLGVDSVFETDILRALIGEVEKFSGRSYMAEDMEKAAPFRVIADHLRTLCFAIADGAQPSNVDRGYVLRKLLRRAVRYGKQLGFERPFLGECVGPLVKLMGDDYHELKDAQGRIEEILTLEEEAFFKTLKKGGPLLNQVIEKAKKQTGVVSGEEAFKLKDTYGLPFEEIALIAKDAHLEIDHSAYLKLELEAKEKSRAGKKEEGQIASSNLFEPFLQEKGATLFVGYAHAHAKGTILGLVKEGRFVEALEEGESGMVLLDQTPFYAEMGGQVGDTGLIKSPAGLFNVVDTKAPFKGVTAHVGRVSQGKLALGQSVESEIDKDRRLKIANNHTATHLLHLALFQVLGPHIKQAGSVVDPERLRFDFSHHKALSEGEIRQIEESVNEEVRANHPVISYEMAYDEAKEKREVKQLFGEKYGTKVRVVETGHAKELCGGTHTSSSGNIGYFRIVKEGSVAAGVRRIEAVTGKEAEKVALEKEEELKTLGELVKAAPGKLKERLEKLLEENKALGEKLKQLKTKELESLAGELHSKIQKMTDCPFIAEEVPLNLDEMRQVADLLMASLSTGALLLGSSQGGKANLYLRLSEALVKKGLNAQSIIKELAPLIEGSGGGKNDQATAGGKAPEKLPLALLKLKNYLC